MVILGMKILTMVAWSSWILGASLAHAAPFEAQNSAPVKVAWPVKTRAKLPDYATKAIPKGGKTLFFGEVSVPDGKKAALLRVHIVQLALEAGQQDDERRCRLDLYLQRARRAPFARVASVPCDGLSGLPIVFAQMMWLDPPTKRVPMLRICSSGMGFYGLRSTNFLLIFPRSLEKPPSQDFRSYSNHSEAVDWNFDARDARGWRRLTQLVDPLGVDAEGDRYFNFDWDGAQFSPAK